MTAKVTELFSCPKCNESLSADNRPKKCPNPICGYVFPDPTLGLTKKFHWPKAPYQQLFELVQQDMEKYKDQPINVLIPTLTKEQADEATVSNALKLKYIKGKRHYELRKFYIESSEDDLSIWLESLLEMYQCLHKSSNKKLIAKMTYWGKRIGQYSEKLEELMNLGAHFYDEIKNVSGDTESRDADDGKGRV